jgi:hypothetical protein
LLLKQFLALLVQTAFWLLVNASKYQRHPPEMGVAFNEGWGVVPVLKTGGRISIADDDGNKSEERCSDSGSNLKLELSFVISV